jgi:hypothetical protein
MSYDRYTQFRKGNEICLVPFGEIPKHSSDKYEIYERGVTRLDLLSYDYYGSPDYAWLILQANPKYGSMEFSIPDGSELRIPYPLSQALGAYQKSIDNYNNLYK